MLKIKGLFQNKYFLLTVWILLGCAATVIKFHKGPSGYNNFLVYKHVFWHAVHHLSLYSEYPADYGDVNLYGITFSWIIAPFAVLPTFLGIILWNIFNIVVLFVAVRMLPLKEKYLSFICLICLNEIYSAGSMQQFNICTVALIVLSYCMIVRNKNCWAALFIAIGLFVKIYGIVGLAFFFFSKDKIKFILWFIFWICVLFLLPVLYTSFAYVVSQYKEWLSCLSDKQSENVFAYYQNISLLGFVRKTTHNANYSDLWLIVPGIILFAIPYLRFKQYKNPSFRMMFLASVLLFIILFSTGSEHSTYIIPYIGVGIWLSISPTKGSTVNTVIIILAIFGSLMTTDLMPHYLKRTYVFPYALKSIPCLIVWIKIITEQYFCDFRKTTQAFLPGFRN